MYIPNVVLPADNCISVKCIVLYSQNSHRGRSQKCAISLHCNYDVPLNNNHSHKYQGHRVKVKVTGAKNMFVYAVIALIFAFFKTEFDRFSGRLYHSS